MRQRFTCPGIIQIALKGLITGFIRILPLPLPCSTRCFCANERLTPNTHNSWLFYHIRMFLPEHSANTRAREKKPLRTAFDSSPVAFFLSEIWSTFHNISGVSCIYPHFPLSTTYYYIRLRSLPSQTQWYPVLSISSPMEWALAVHSNSFLMNSPYLHGLLLCLSHPSLSALWGHFLPWFRLQLFYNCILGGKTWANNYFPLWVLFNIGKFAILPFFCNPVSGGCEF